MTFHRHTDKKTSVLLGLHISMLILIGAFFIIGRILRTSWSQDKIYSETGGKEKKQEEEIQYAKTQDTKKKESNEQNKNTASGETFIHTTAHSMHPEGEERDILLATIKKGSNTYLGARQKRNTEDDFAPESLLPKLFKTFFGDVYSMQK